MFQTFLDGQPPVGLDWDIGRTSDRNFPKVVPLVSARTTLSPVLTAPVSAVPALFAIVRALPSLFLPVKTAFRRR